MKLNKSITNNIRKSALASIFYAESGHPGGVLSCIDLLAYIFYDEMDYQKNDFTMIDRDRFILSKGHCAPALYAVAAELEIIDIQRLKGLRKLNHELQGHTHRISTPFVEASTGSLGQGFSFAIGQSVGLKMHKSKHRVYTMIGDGEMQEGEIWEGAMFAGHNKLNNLCAIVDYNKMQSDNLNENIISIEPLVDKWKSFSWHVLEIDGHDFDDIEQAFKLARLEKNMPTIIIAHTIKGKGVSFMENLPLWHGSLKLSDEDIVKALEDLSATKEEILEVLNGK
jgi:transketolase